LRNALYHVANFKPSTQAHESVQVRPATQAWRVRYIAKEKEKARDTLSQKVQAYQLSHVEAKVTRADRW